MLLLFTACDKDDNNEATTGQMEIEFDNVAIMNNVPLQLDLVEPGSTTYQYTNALDQKFNINLLRYYITNVKLEGPNGEVYTDKMEIDASKSNGVYLVDEAASSSQLITLKDVPAGEYNKLTFTVGVPEEGVQEGVAGGSLDPATCNMFWNWNAGYVAVKYEGQSDVSNGGAGGESINDVANGMAYHIGGWRDMADTPFINNNQTITVTFDTKAKVSGSEQPHVHMYFDIISLFKGQNTIDFTGNHNVHKPTDGKPCAENIPTAFRFDHIHQ